jgi:hypothetical protein
MSADASQLPLRVLDVLHSVVQHHPAKKLAPKTKPAHGGFWVSSQVLDLLLNFGGP